MRDEAAVSWGEGRIDLFWRDDDDALWHRSFDGVAWGAAESLGGQLATGMTPAASSWGDDRLDVFATGVDGHAWHRYWNGTSWVEWARLDAA